MIKVLRKLLDGSHAEELNEPINLTIKTRCPEKWILIDQQTGQVYQGSKEPSQYGSWDWINIEPLVEDESNRLNRLMRSKRLQSAIARIKREDNLIMKRLEDGNG